jgi:NAD-dependent DNA ligase
MNNGIGPGARIEVIYHAKVNPRVERVLERAADLSETALLPKLPYTWVGGDETNGPVHIRFNEAAEASPRSGVVSSSIDEVRQTIEIKRIYKFLVDIGAKGIGETTVKKIYDSGHRSIRDFINMTRADIDFLGSTLSKNIVDSISTALHEADLAVLMGSSGVFGRGMGVRKLARIFLKYPDFEQAAQKLSEKELVAMIGAVEGFGPKTAGPVAAAMPAYYRFAQEIPADIYQQIRANRAGLQASADCGAPSVAPAGDKTERHPDLDGRGVCMTGFRDPEVERIIVRHGGTVQNSINGKTGLLVRVNGEYNNSKTAAASGRGIHIISKAEFEALYA